MKEIHIIYIIFFIFIILYFLNNDIENYCSISTCNTGFTLSNDNCVSCSPITGISGNYTTDCKASSCINGYKLENGTCNKCNITGALTYNDDCTAKTCTESGYKLSNGNCCKLIDGISGDYTTDCKASSCIFDYTLSNGTCNPVIAKASSTNFLNNSSGNNIAIINPNNSYTVVVNSTVSGSNEWTYTDIKDCEYIISNNKSNQALDSGIANTHYGDKNGGDYQKWVLFKMNGKTYVYNRKTNNFLYFNGVKNFYIDPNVLTNDNLILPDNLNYNNVDESKTITSEIGGVKKYLSCDVTNYEKKTTGFESFIRDTIASIYISLEFKDTIDIYSSWTIKNKSSNNSYFIYNDITGLCLDYGRGNNYKVYLNGNFSNTDNENINWKFYDGGNGKSTINTKIGDRKLLNTLYTTTDDKNTNYLFTIGDKKIIYTKIDSNKMISFNVIGSKNYLIASNSGDLSYSTQITKANEFEFIYKSVYTDKYGYYKIQTKFDTQNTRYIDSRSDKNYLAMDESDNSHKFNFGIVGDNKYNIFSVENCKILCYDTKANKLDYTDLNNTETTKIKEFTIYNITNSMSKNKNTILFYYYNNYNYNWLSLSDNKLITMNSINNYYYPVTSYWYMELSSDSGSYFYIKNSAINGNLDTGNYIDVNKQELNVYINDSEENDDNYNYIRWKIHLIKSKYYLYSKVCNGYLFYNTSNNKFTIVKKDKISNSTLLGEIFLQKSDDSVYFSGDILSKSYYVDQ